MRMNNENYSFAEYQANAQHTESPISPELISRFSACESLIISMFDALSRFIAVNGYDELKKHVYYGKLNSLLPSPNIPQALKVNLDDEFITREIRLAHAIIGKITELEELLDAFAVGIDMHEFDTVNLMEELGDDQWYNALLASAIGQPLENAALANINKLKQRYKDKFTELAAKERNLAEERKLLEAHAAIGLFPPAAKRDPGETYFG